MRQIATFEYSQEYPIIWRRDRVPNLTVQADVAPGMLPATAADAVRPSIDRLAATLPSGYRIVPGDSRGERQGEGVRCGGLANDVVVILTILMFQLQSFSACCWC